MIIPDIVWDKIEKWRCVHAHPYTALAIYQQPDNSIEHDQEQIT